MELVFLPLIRLAKPWSGNRMLGRARQPNATSKAAAAKTTLTTQRLRPQVAW